MYYPETKKLYKNRSLCYYKSVDVPVQRWTEDFDAT